MPYVIALPPCDNGIIVGGLKWTTGVERWTEEVASDCVDIVDVLNRFGERRVPAKRRPFLSGILPARSHCK